MHRPLRPVHGHGPDVLQRMRREGRWWWLQARHARRIWRWALLVSVVLFVCLMVVRRPLADWFWNEPRIEQTLEQAEAALAAGHLSAADGSGARELFRAALALDGDRSEARDGLQRTGAAALLSTGKALQDGDLDAAAASLELARDLQVPEHEADHLAAELRSRRNAQEGIATLLERAEAALRAHRLDEGDDSALPLFDQVLAIAPDQLSALEGREDALSDLLQQARDACQAGELVKAASLLKSARSYDPGHVDLPQSEGQFNAAMEQLLARADRESVRGRIDVAVKHYSEVLAAISGQAHALYGLRRLADRQAQQAIRFAGDFRFSRARQALEKAVAIDPQAPSLTVALTAIEQARHAYDALHNPDSRYSKAEVEALLTRFGQARARGDWLLPPGQSAYDALRAAQAIAPAEPAVQAATGILVSALIECFDDELRRNRVRAAGECLQAWDTVTVHDTTLVEARNRLGRRWLALGNERLGAGDAGYAREALQQARELGVSASEYEPLRKRLGDASALER